METNSYYDKKLYFFNDKINSAVFMFSYDLNLKYI